MRRILKANGTFEPIADNRPEDNMIPVGRLYYNASTMICVPPSLDSTAREQARTTNQVSIAAIGNEIFATSPARCQS
jgi:hypothetical protein